MRVVSGSEWRESGFGPRSSEPDCVICVFYRGSKHTQTSVEGMGLRGIAYVLSSQQVSRTKVVCFQGSQYSWDSTRWCGVQELTRVDLQVVIHCSTIISYATASIGVVNNKFYLEGLRPCRRIPGSHTPTGKGGVRKKEQQFRSEHVNYLLNILCTERTNRVSVRKRHGIILPIVSMQQRSLLRGP